MKRKQYHYQRKLRQFRYLSKQVNRLLEQRDTTQLQNPRFQKLVEKLQHLYLQLRQVISGKRLRRALAGATFLLALGATQPAMGQTFADGLENPFNLESTLDLNPNLPTFADLDNDGDLDMLSTGYGLDDLYLGFKFFENVGTATAPEFTEPVNSPFGLNAVDVFTPSLGDLDNDGDLDILTSNYGYYDANMLYFENVGTPDAPSYAPAQEDPFGLSVASFIDIPKLVDLDNDGDLDVLSSGLYGLFTYYENIGTPEAPAYTAGQSTPFGLPGPGVVILNFFDIADLDGDGDLDMLYHIYDDVNDTNTKMYFAENIGTAENPEFTTGTPMPFNVVINGYYAAQPAMADIDDDGDVDVFVSIYNGGTLYFENTGPANTPPTSENASVTTDEDVAYAFSVDDFPYTDGDMDDLALIKITELPSAGALTLDGATVLINQEIPAADIGLLVFTPAADEFGDPYATFNFQVSDGSDFSADYTMTIVVLEDTSSATDRLLNAQVTLSPNPVSEMLTVDVRLDAQAEELTLSIRNAQGMIVQQSSANAGRQTQFNLSSLPAGLYLLELRSGGKWKTVKFVKQ